MEKVVLVPSVFYLVGCVVAFSLLEWLFSRKLSLPLDSKDHFILLLFSLFSWFMVFCLFGIFGFKSFRKADTLPHQKYLTPKRIWVLEQNKPSLIADDLEKFYNVPREATHAILLARGVYKWLAVRRDLIRLKNEWKDELTRLQEEAKKYRRGSIERAKISARIRTLTECRQAIRKLCHSSRWQAPDNDKEAVLFLKRLEEADGFSGK